MTDPNLLGLVLMLHTQVKHLRVLLAYFMADPDIARQVAPARLSHIDEMTAEIDDQIGELRRPFDKAVTT